jgi:hypothetical protein
MGSAHPYLRGHEVKLPPHRHDAENADVNALLEENAQLRDLVVKLSSLVLRNIAGQK